MPRRSESSFRLPVALVAEEEAAAVAAAMVEMLPKRRKKKRLRKRKSRLTWEVVCLEMMAEMTTKRCIDVLVELQRTNKNVSTRVWRRVFIGMVVLLLGVTERERDPRWAWLSKGQRTSPAATCVLPVVTEHYYRCCCGSSWCSFPSFAIRFHQD